MVASDALAQKTVTYTFKGSVLGNSSILGALGLTEQKLELKSSGKVPAGVPDPTIKCSIHPHTPVVGNAHDGGDFENYDKHLLGGLSTLYCVEENELGKVKFHNFKYEVMSITWRRRSQWSLMTSQGGSWLEDYTGQEVDESFVEYGTEDGLESTYTTSGEIFYHDRNFIVPNNPYDYTKGYRGIGSLNVFVRSTKSYQGIAVKDFDITYYEPQPLIDKVDNGGGNYTVTVEIGPEQHVGAFTDKDFVLVYDKERLVITNGGGKGEVSYDPINKKIVGLYDLSAKPSAPAGNAVVSAIIKNGGTDDNPIVAGRSNTSVKIPVGTKNGFVVEESYHWQHNNNNDDYYGNNGNGKTIWGTSSGSSIVLAGDSPTGQVTSEILGHYTSNARPWRARATELSYTQVIPPYTDIVRKFTIKGAATISGGVTDNGTYNTADACDLGENKLSKGYQFVYNNSGNLTSPTYRQHYNNGGTGDDSSSSGDFEWTFENSDKATGSDSKTEERYVVLACHVNHTALANRTNDWKFTYSNPSDAFKYEYYAYLTFLVDEDSPIAGAPTQTIHKGKTVNETILLAKGGILENVPVVTATDNLAPSSPVEKVGHTLVGWIDIDDDNKFYDINAPYCPYDALNECGKGPHRLVAQWQEDDVPCIVTFIADGGKIKGVNKNMSQVMINTKSSDFTPSIICSSTSDDAKNMYASKVGYTFDGYVDSEGNKVFDATGQLESTAKGGKYFYDDGKWKYDGDTEFYALFVENFGAVDTKNTIQFMDNDGIALWKEATVIGESMTGSNVGAIDAMPIRDGYKFIGWFRNADGTADGDIMMYSPEGQAVYIASVTEEDIENGIPAEVTYAGYDSEYWNGDGWIWHDTATPIKLYSHWVQIIKDTKINFNDGNAEGDHNSFYTYNGGSKTGMASATYSEAQYDDVFITRGFTEGKYNTFCSPCNIYSYQCNLLFSSVRKLTGATVSGDNITMKFVEVDEIEAGVPYFVKLKDGYNTTEKIKDGTHPIYYGAHVSDKNGDIYTIDLKTVPVVTEPTNISITEDGKTVTMHGHFETKARIGSGLGYDENLQYLYLLNDKFYVSGGNYVDEEDGKTYTYWGNGLGFRAYFSQPKTNTGGDAKIMTLSLDLEGFDGWTGVDAIELVECDQANSNEGTIYDLAGRRLGQKPTHGVYIMNGKKFIVK